MSLHNYPKVPCCSSFQECSQNHERLQCSPTRYNRVHLAEVDSVQKLHASIAIEDSCMIHILLHITEVYPFVSIWSHIFQSMEHCGDRTNQQMQFWQGNDVQHYIGIIFILEDRYVDDIAKFFRPFFSSNQQITNPSTIFSKSSQHTRVTFKHVTFTIQLSHTMCKGGLTHVPLSEPVYQLASGLLLWCMAALHYLKPAQPST